MTEIGANSVLPAKREAVTLRTADGLNLVGELALPENGPVTGTILWFHPLPTAGGFMDSHLIRKSSWRLPALTGLAVLRFNSRGTVSPAGRSEGEFDGGDSERYDLGAALDFVAQRGLPAPWAVGWSFGTDVILRWGNVDPVVGAVLLSPPGRWSGEDALPAWAESGRPILCLVPELDDFARPDAVARRFGAVPQAEVVGVEGAKHLWVGEKYVRVALNGIVGRVLPGSAPLPIEWDGPMERWTDI